MVGLWEGYQIQDRDMALVPNKVGTRMDTTTTLDKEIQDGCEAYKENSSS